jgi:hypothetical protein
VLGAVPDHRRRLTDGILVEASILGRVLGIRILTLDATLVLVPAHVSASSPAALHRPARPPTHSAVPSTRLGPAGQGLAKAVQSINEAAELLATTRHNSS